MTAHLARRWQVAVVTLLLAAWSAVALAAPAGAHGSGDATLPNLTAVVIDPGDPGLRWTTGADGYVELRVQRGTEAVVVGYQDEPFLRFAADGGVFENLQSPTARLSLDRHAGTDLPDLDPAAAPQWQLLDDGQTAGWHDHRAHWMSPDLPPAVLADPDRRHLVDRWAIPVRVDGTTTPVLAAGELRWSPDRRWWPPVVALTLLPTALVVAVAVVQRRSPRRWQALASVSMTLLLAVAAANLARTVDDLAAPMNTAERLGSVVVSVVTFVAIVGFTMRGRRASAGAFLSLAAAGVLTMLLFGGESFSELSAPALDTALPLEMRRWTVAASYVVVVPVAVATTIAGRWYRRTADA